MTAHELAFLLLMQPADAKVFYHHPEWMRGFLVNSLDLIDGKVYLGLVGPEKDDPENKMAAILEE